MHCSCISRSINPCWSACNGESFLQEAFYLQSGSLQRIMVSVALPLLRHSIKWRVNDILNGSRGGEALCPNQQNAHNPRCSKRLVALISLFVTSTITPI